MRTQQKLTLLLSPFLFTALAAADPAVYVVTLSQQFGTVDLATGAFAPIGPGTPEVDANLVPAPNGMLYSIATGSGSLVTINPATGATTPIGPTGLGSDAFAFAGVGGKLFVTDFSNNLYSVNPATGATTPIGPTGIPPDPAVPFTMNPDGTINLCDETLYGVGDKLYASFDAFTIDPATLAITQTVAPNLWSIDPSTGIAAKINGTSLNLLSSVYVDGTYYAFHGVFTGFGPFGPESFSELTTLNLANGTTSFVRDIDPAAGAIFGASPVVPEPASIAIAAVGMIAVFFCVGWRRRSSLRFPSIG